MPVNFPDSPSNGATHTVGNITYVYDSAKGLWKDSPTGVSSDVLEDTTPQLGGSLDVNGNSIISASNGDIPIAPNGSGKIVLDGLSWPTSDGSASQVLKTDGSGNLGFFTVASGGLTHLSTVTASGASTVDVETALNATYDAYKLIVSDMTVSNDGAQIQGLMKIGGSYITSGTYDFLHKRLAVDASGNTYSDGFGTSSNFIVAQSMGNDSYASANFELNIYNPADTAIRHVVRFLGSYYEDDNDIHHVYGIGQNSTTGALTGIRFQPSAGTISGNFRLYGITNG